MKRIKHALLAAAFTAGSLVASPASAGWQIWNGSAWVSTGVANFTGQIVLSYLGITLPCNSNWTWSLSNGSFAVTAVSLTGSSACNSTVASGLPWAVSSPAPYTGPNPPAGSTVTLTPVLSNVTMSGVNFGGSCTANVAGVFDRTDNPPTPALNRYFFQASSGACSIRTNSVLTSSVPIRWM